MTSYSLWDRSGEFIQTIDALRQQTLTNAANGRVIADFTTQSVIEDLAARFAINNRNRIKPTIAEATRAILRRDPECVLVNGDGRRTRYGITASSLWEKYSVLPDAMTLHLTKLSPLLRTEANDNRVFALIDLVNRPFILIALLRTLYFLWHYYTL